MRFLSFLLLSMAVFFASCGWSGDGLAKKLSRKGGKWSIERLVWQIVEQDIPNQNIYDGEESGGTLTFTEDGNMRYDYNLNGVQRSGSAVWSINETDLQITYIDLANTVSGALTVDYTVQHEGANNIKLQCVETYTDSIARSITNSMSFELERRQ